MKTLKFSNVPLNLNMHKNVYLQVHNGNLRRRKKYNMLNIQAFTIIFPHILVNIEIY